MLVLTAAYGQVKTCKYAAAHAPAAHLEMLGLMAACSHPSPSGTPGVFGCCVMTSELAILAANDCLTSSRSVVVLLLICVEISGAAAFATVRRAV
jgi:hypothetical protein